VCYPTATTFSADLNFKVFGWPAVPLFVLIWPAADRRESQLYGAHLNLSSYLSSLLVGSANEWPFVDCQITESAGWNTAVHLAKMAPTAKV
jgi:hypothetical protein